VARAEDTVLIRPGSYRESLIPRNSGEPGKPIIFRGEPMAREQADQAVIKGSDPVRGFERESDNLWVKRPWRNPGWYSAEFDSIPDDKHKASARIDEVFINERPLRWAPAREQLEQRSFYWSAAELVVWPSEPVDDLNAQLVEVPVRWKVAGAWMQDIPRGWNELIEHRGDWTRFSIDGRSMGYLVDAGEPILLIDLHTAGTQRRYLERGFRFRWLGRRYSKLVIVNKERSVGLPSSRSRIATPRFGFSATWNSSSTRNLSPAAVVISNGMPSFRAVLMFSIFMRSPFCQPAHITRMRQGGNVQKSVRFMSR
jgi:hypothetical protein